MPMRVVTFRRWQVFIAFLGISLAFIVTGVVLADAIQSNDRAIRSINEFRAERTQQTSATAALLCERIEVLKGTLRQILTEQEALSAHLRIPGLTISPAVRKAESRQFRRDLELLAARSCASLPTSKPPALPTSP